jgi:hypothetical protein
VALAYGELHKEPLAWTLWFFPSLLLLLRRWHIPKRKEVRRMTYNRPEIAVLGDAFELVLGQPKGGGTEPNPPTSQHAPSFELED